MHVAPESVAFSRLQGAVKARHWDRVQGILGKGGDGEDEKDDTPGAGTGAGAGAGVKGKDDGAGHGHILAKLYPPAGFGELSTLTGVKMAVTVRAAWDTSNPDAITAHTATSGGNGDTTGANAVTTTNTNTAVATSSSKDQYTDLLVVPKAAMLACVAARRSTHTFAGTAPSEAMELFRQTGLAQGAVSSDLMRAATSMVKHNLNVGDVLYRMGEPANRLFLVVSGDIVLDTTKPDSTNTDSEGNFVPFMHRYVCIQAGTWVCLVLHVLTPGSQHASPSSPPPPPPPPPQIQRVGKCVPRLWRHCARGRGACRVGQRLHFHCGHRISEGRYFRSTTKRLCALLFDATC